MPYPYDTYTYPRISSVDQLSGADLFPLWVQQNGGSCALSLALLTSYLEDNITIASGTRVAQYSAPSATGFSVSVGSGIDDGVNIWLILTPVAGYAAGTLVLPAVADVVDKQEINVNCTQSVTTLTVSGNGATVTGAPTTLAANAVFTLRFDAVMTTWYRVG